MAAAQPSAIDLHSLYEASVSQLCTENDNPVPIKKMPIVRSRSLDAGADHHQRSLRNAANALAALWKTNRRR